MKLTNFLRNLIGRFGLSSDKTLPDASDSDYGCNSEWNRCKNDLVYFIENYCKVRHAMTEDVTLIDLYDWQKEALTMYRSKNVIASTCSVAGKSTLLACIILHQMIFMKGINIGVVVGHGMLWSLHRKTKDINNTLPPGMKLDILAGQVYESHHSDRNNSVQFLSPGMVRGRSFSNLFIDEAALLETFEMTSVMKSLRPGGKFVLLSTPNGGLGNGFWETFHYTLSNTDVHHMKVDWTKIPTWTEEKIMNAKKKYSHEMIEREVNADFF